MQAFFDDESCVTFRKRKEGYDRSIRLQSINKKGLVQLRQLLGSIGVNSKKIGSSNNDINSSIFANSSLEEDVIKERIPTDALHATTSYESSDYIPVYDKINYEVSTV